ncbi:MAG: hypothetical protein WBP45_08495 [Daejeonella sp.]
MKKISLITCIAFIVSVVGCSDKKEPDTLNGKYTGVFYYSGPTPATLNFEAILPHPASITFSNNNYTSVGNNDHYPAGGSGTFKFLSENSKQILFEDKNVWTADFDWNLVLNGEYKYELKKDSLILSKKINNTSNSYVYRLKRVR